MTSATRSPTSSARAADPILADLVEQFLERLQAGEALDPTGFAAAHPEHAEALRQLLPALEMMAALSHSAARARAGVAPTADIAGPGLGLLGDFHILREVGRGGMGVVYEAEQVSLRRRVALKVLPFAAALDPRQLARFKSEAQATALLHHTNIVPVHAVGAERGVHYYAMQFIDGRTLADVINELRQLEGKNWKSEARDVDACEGEAPSEPVKAETCAGRGSPDPAIGTASAGRGSPEPAPAPTEGLPAPAGAGRRSSDPALGPTEGLPVPRPPSSSSTRNRAYFRNVARLGLEAAEALEHAHQEGIIHRDIKPANLMVDAKGHLWVTDFGLARLRSDGGLTVSGDLLGTLRYMSPEQASGKRVIIDGRTDIYSLGVTLYELLTLEPAFEGRDRQEMLRRLAEEDPRAPRQLDAAIPRELETILLKATSKEPESRYATAQELAADLERFLEHKPIRAKRPSVVERTAKWARRHTAVVGAALAILTVALLALLVNYILLSQEQQRTVAALNLAETRSQQARKAVDTMYTRVAEKWLIDQPGLRPLQQEFLQEALAFYREFALEKGGNFEAQIDAAVALRRVGEIQDMIGSYDQTSRIFLKAIDVLKGLADRLSDNPRRLEALGDVQCKLARNFRIHGRLEDAFRQYTEAMEVYQTLAIRFPERTELRGEQGRCLTGLGATKQDAGKPEEAEQLYRRAGEIFESLLTRPHTQSQGTRGLKWVNHNLANLYWTAGRFSEAENCYRRATELSAQLLKGSPESLSTKHDHASDIYGLAGTLRSQCKWPEAAKTVGEAIAIQEPLAAEFPERSEFREDLAASLCLRGMVLHELRRLTEEDHDLRRSIGISTELIKATPRLVVRRTIMAEALIALAILERERKHIDASEGLLAEAFSHIQIGLGLNPLDPDLKNLNLQIESLRGGRNPA